MSWMCLVYVVAEAASSDVEGSRMDGNCVECSAVYRGECLRLVKMVTCPSQLSRS